MPFVPGPYRCPRYSSRRHLGGLAVLMGMIRAIAAIATTATVAVAAIYVVLVLGSRRGIKYYYG